MVGEIFDADPTKEAPFDADPTKEAQRIFAGVDVDGDGFLTLQDCLSRAPDPQEARRMFDKMDADGDGKISDG